MSAQDVGFVSWHFWFVVSDGRIFPKRNAHSDNLRASVVNLARLQGVSLGYLLCNVLHLFPDQVIAVRVKEDRKFPGISKGDQMRLARKELHVEHFECCNLFSGDWRFVYPLSQCGM